VGNGHEASELCDAAGLDLFALGAIAYEAVFRRTPYAQSAGAELEAPLFDGPAGYSPLLLAVIERLIAVDPRRRIRSARELLDALPATPEPARAASTAATPARAQAPAHDSELLSILEFLQRRFGSRKTQQAEGAVVHSSLRERVVVWALLLLLLTGTVLALLPE
jgi:serine/threonine protein kinase